jgi:hypothetical protein
VPLASFSETYWFPDGSLAANTPARIFPRDSNSLAVLWADPAGTIPLPNPLSTNGSGQLFFWAEEGEYWIFIRNQTFRVSVGSPDLDVFEATSSSLSTGLLSGGELNVNAITPTSLDIGPTVGYVLDFNTDPEVPGFTRVSTPAQTVPLDGPALTRVVTWWLMTSTGAIVQQAARPSNSQRRQMIVLGATVYDSTAGAITLDQSLPVIYPGAINQMADLMDALGPFNIFGNVVTPNGANLSLTKSAGDVFVRAFNRFAGPTLTLDPHVSSVPAQALVTLRRITRVAQFPLTSPFTTINPGLWDNNGVLTAVTGNDATIQRVWLFPANAVGDQIAVQYGQQLFADFSTAIDSIGSGAFVPNPTTVGNAVLIAHVIVQGNATALNNPAQCIIRRASKLDYP